MPYLSKNEIMSWSNRYDIEEDQYNTRLEEELGKRLRQTKELSKNDLIAVVEWKFLDKKKREETLARIEPVEDSFIRKMTKEALTEGDEEKRMWTLQQIPSVGPSVASVILTFYDPKNYGIFDTHAWSEMFGTNPPDLFIDSSYFRIFLDRLREESKKHDLDARTIEKAYFKKNKDESMSS